MTQSEQELYQIASLVLIAGFILGVWIRGFLKSARRQNEE